MAPTDAVSARTRTRIWTAAGAGGATLALLQPIPYAFVLAFNDAVAPDPYRSGPGSAFLWFWGSPFRWIAVVAFAITIGVLLTRTARLTAGRVRAVLASSVAAYVVVGAVALAVTAGGGAGAVVVDIALSVGLYGTAWLAGVVALAVCGWAHRYGSPKSDD